MKVNRNLLLFLCGLMLACSSDPERDQDLQLRPEQTFHMVQTTAIETLDPMRVLFQADWQLTSMIYEGLVGYGENSAEIVPLLAERWEVLDGGLRYIFHLRPNVYFHDDPCFPEGRGKKLSSVDVSYTFYRLDESKSECPNAHLFEGKIKQIRVLDEFRIEFTLNQPYAVFLKILASPTAYIVSSEAVEYYGENFSYHPVGTGPFRLIQWKPFFEILLAKHTRYWREDAKGKLLPRLDAIRIKLESSREKEFNEFVRGENQLYRAETLKSRKLLKNLFNPEAYHVLKAPFGLTSRFFGFSLNKDTPLAQNPSLRRALASAFDRSALFKNGTPDQVGIAESMVPSGLLENADLHWYETDNAERIDSLQFRNSQLFSQSITLLSNIESPEIRALINAFHILAIPHDLKIQKVGYFPAIIEERPDLFRVAYLPSIPDPEDYYGFFYSKSTPDVNLTGYSSPEFDILFESSRIESDPEKRNALFLEMESLIRRDVPILPISHSMPSLYLYPKSAQGLKMRFLLLDFSEVTLGVEH